MALIFKGEPKKLKMELFQSKEKNVGDYPHWIRYVNANSRMPSTIASLPDFYLFSQQNDSPNPPFFLENMNDLGILTNTLIGLHNNDGGDDYFEVSHNKNINNPSIPKITIPLVRLPVGGIWSMEQMLYGAQYNLEFIQALFFAGGEEKEKTAGNLEKMFGYSIDKIKVSIPPSLVPKGKSKKSLVVHLKDSRYAAPFYPQIILAPEEREGFCYRAERI